MLSYQQNYFNTCVKLTRELWERVAGDPSLQKKVHNCTDIYSRLGKGAAYDAQKKKLPLVMFCCTFEPNKGPKKDKPLNTWRCQSAVNINGLFMYDADELRFSEVMFNSVVAWQDAYFGQMLQDSWENADKAFVPRVKRSKNADAYILLPQEFTNADVQKVLDISSGGASMQIDRWVTSGFVEKLSKNHYKKIVDFIIM